MKCQRWLVIKLLATVALQLPLLTKQFLLLVIRVDALCIPE